MKMNREQLLKRLALLRPALKSGGMIVELGHIWFKEGVAFAFGGPGEQRGMLGARVKLDVGLACGLPGDVLLGLLASSRLPEASLDPDEQGVVTLKLGRSVSKLASLKLDRGVWPFPKDGEPQERVSVDEVFLAALARALVVDPKSVSRVEHRGVVFYRDKRGAALSATDSTTIVVVALAAVLKKQYLPVMLPRAFAEQVVKACSVGDELLLYDDYLVVVGADVSIYTQVVDVTEVQDVREIVAGVVKKHPEAVPIPAGLKIALERAVLLAGGDDAVADVAVAKGDLTVRGKYKYGELSERVRLKAEHPDAQAQFTASRVLRGLDGAKSFSLDENALLLCGGQGDIYAVAPRRA